MRKVVSVVLGIMLILSTIPISRTDAAGTITYRLSPYSKRSVNSEDNTFTFEYFANEKFQKMEKYVETSNPDQNYWTDESGKVIIKGWTMSATSLAYAVVGFHAPESGYVDLRNLRNLRARFEPSFESGELMIVHKSDMGYSPIYPVRDSWEYLHIPKRTSGTDDTTYVVQEPSRTYVKKGETIYFILRGNEISTKQTTVDSEFAVDFTASASDPEGLYPKRWTPFRGHTVVRIIEPLAVLSPDGNEKIMQFKQDRPVFNDRFNCVFKHIPDSFENKSFIFTDCWGDSVGWESSATVTQAGVVYVIASPAKRQTLLDRGYTLLPNQEFTLFWGGNAGDRPYIFEKWVDVGEKVPVFDRWSLAVFAELDESEYDIHPSYQTTNVVKAPNAQFSKAERKWQGTPTIAQTDSNVFWAAWISGGDHEVAPGNYGIIARSTDGGNTYQEMFYFAPPVSDRKVIDVTLWTDPDGRLWAFYNQGRGVGDNYQGVWAACMENPNAEEPEWSAPSWISLGMVRNKPVVLSNGDWLLAIYDMLDEDVTNVIASTDKGSTWYKRGSARVENAYVDEPMIVEKKDGSLWMLVRSNEDYGIAESFSYDKGRTWTDGRDSQLGGPGSRFNITRLRSGNLLLVNHYNFTGRNNLAAFLSEDDGQTWPYVLMLDERSLVSYPDSVEDENGVITIIYDRERYGAKEILTVTLTEEDIKAGAFQSEVARQKYVIDTLTTEPEPWDANISWYIQQNKNPYDGSYFIFSYFDGNEFKKMESYQLSEPAFWQSASGTSGIQGWQVWASGTESPVVKFYSGKSGILKITDDVQIKANSGQGRYIIVQQNGEGKYCPIYPERGVWEYKDITSTAFALPEVETYVNTGDAVYIIYEKTGEGLMVVSTIAHANFVEKATDDRNLRPTEWTGWQGTGADDDHSAARAVEQLIDSIPRGLTYADRHYVENAYSAYNALTETQKSLVGNVVYLLAAKEKFSLMDGGMDVVANVISKINSIPDEITLEHEEAILLAAASYDMLTSSEKGGVNNYAKLQNALNKLDELKNGPEDPPEEEPVRYLHSWAYNESDKASPHSVNIGGAPAFYYMMGLNGNYTGLTRFSTLYNAWSDDDKNPLVGSYFLGGYSKNDGVIRWQAPDNGSIVLKSSIPVKKNAGNDSYLMIVQERDGQFAPLYPEKGKFKWLKITGDTQFTLLDVESTVVQGDNIYIIVRSIDGVVEIDPDIYFTPGEADELTFADWDDSKDELLFVVSRAEVISQQEHENAELYNIMMNKLAEAIAVYEDDNAAEDDIAAATEGLQKALDELLDLATDPSDDEDDEDDDAENPKTGDGVHISILLFVLLISAAGLYLKSKIRFKTEANDA